MKLIECPRDAMQGLQEFIPTEDKVRYINQLLKVGFDSIDFGSFVSAKAIPQLRDTAAVYEQLNWQESPSKLLAIVANTRGAKDAIAFEGITYLGFPMSLSETFQQRNTNKSIAEALNELSEIKNLCESKGKKLVTYVSMGFGNPYNDPYAVDLVGQFVDILVTLGSDVISLSDTIGVSSPDNIKYLFTSLSKAYPSVEIGVHLHSNPATAVEKIQAAYESGCKRFDGALKGFGGCPMADDELVGNMATETILTFLDEKGVNTGIDKQAFAEAMKIASTIFPTH
ncbi:MAG: hydroxymethylglutaryl-CoA lyase [Cytophagia bacterium]|nr:hydroxymethylglutaryl-CoA lyase [Cytophagia bacterium]NBW34885.1 hydroxymethylglutaryl-CoA lyase [Cytophagia bacterium]